MITCTRGRAEERRNYLFVTQEQGVLQDLEENTVRTAALDAARNCWMQCRSEWRAAERRRCMREPGHEPVGRTELQSNDQRLIHAAHYHDEFIEQIESGKVVPLE